MYKWRSGIEDEISSAIVEADANPAMGAEPNQEGKASSRKRYTADQKEKALQLCDQIGITKASKETGITINSLRKWRADAQNEIAPANEAPVPKSAADQSASQTDNESQSMAIIARLTKVPSEEPAPEDEARQADEHVNTDVPIAGESAPADNYANEEAPPLPNGKEASVDGTREELIRLRVENSALKAQIASLKNALRVFTE